MGKIKKAEIFKIEYDLGGYKLSWGTLNVIHAVLVKLIDNKGNVGWGEANPHQPFTIESADDVFNLLRDELLPIVKKQKNADPSTINDLLNQEYPANEHRIAKGAINIALMDLEGKRVDQPVAELLGDVLRRKIEICRPLSNGTAEEDIPIIEAAMKEGYRHFMLKMGHPDYPVSGEIVRVAKLQERFGDSITVNVDANAGWSVEQGREFFKAVSNYPIFVEQPVRDIDGLAELQKITDLNITVDESLTGMDSAKEIVEKGAAKGFSIKISKNGGILDAQAIAQFGENNGISCFPNSMGEGGITQAASLALTATLPNLIPAGGSFRSVLRLKGDPTNFHTFIDGGVVTLPDGPGLGIEVDEEKVRAAAVESCQV